MVILNLEEITSIANALANISQMSFQELGGVLNVRLISKAKKAVESARKKRQKIVSKDFKELQEEYSHTDKPLEDKEGNFAGYEWKEGANKEEYREKHDAIKDAKVEVDLPDLKLPLGQSPRLSMLAAEALMLGFGDDVITDANV